MTAFLGWGLTPQSLTNVTPFTYRDNATYLQILQETRNKVNDMIAAINTNAGAESADVAAINAQYTALVANWNAILPNLDPAHVQTLVTDLQTSLTNTINQADTAIATATTATEAANTAAAAAVTATNSLTDFQTAITASITTTVNTAVAGEATIARASEGVIATNLIAEASTARAAELANATAISGKRSKGDTELRPEDYGAVWDGVTDDTIAIQAAINAAPVGGVVRLSPGIGKITSPLTINKSITLVGASMYSSCILAYGCNGIQIVAGTSDVHIENLEIAQSVRYSTTPNTYIGIVVDGVTALHTRSHVYRDVYVDGFYVACTVRYTWNTIFDNFKTDFGLIGIVVYGLSVNNTIVNSQIASNGVVGTRAIVFAGVESSSDPTAVANEGWIISNNLFFNCETAIDSFGTTHVFIMNNIIDFCSLNGIKIAAQGTYFGGNFQIIGNYIAMQGTTGVAGIYLANAVANVQNTGNRIQGNYILTYDSCVCANAINTAAESRMNATGNTIKGGFLLDIQLVSDGNIVVGNHCLSTPGASGNISGVDDSHHSLVADNIGVVYLMGGTPNVYRMSAMGKRIYSGLNAPAVGTYAWGDSVENCRPTVGQPRGWTCTVAGNPGTWVSIGNL